MRPGSSLGYWIGSLVAVALLVLLLLPEQEHQHASGPVNTGHETIECESCHRPAQGTARQQIQANVRYWLGLRSAGANFQFRPVTNKECLACHERPNDNHPAHRFMEPRFAEARAAITPQLCVSCHREHQGGRVTIEPTYCQECHDDLVLKNEPLDISHQQLVADKKWESCLACHDFHGNHIMELPTVVGEGLTPEKIDAYFKGSQSPYSDRKHHLAKESLDE